MLNPTFLIKIDQHDIFFRTGYNLIGLNIAWIGNEYHLEIKMADNQLRTRMCHLQFLHP